MHLKEAASASKQVARMPQEPMLRPSVVIKDTLTTGMRPVELVKKHRCCGN